MTTRNSIKNRKTCSMYMFYVFIHIVICVPIMYFFERKGLEISDHIKNSFFFFFESMENFGQISFNCD